MASSNKKPKAQRVATHEGAFVAKAGALEQLRRTVLACLLFEDTFYEDGQTAAQRIRENAHAVPVTDVLNLAVDARTVHKLRHAPLWLLAAALSHPARAGHGGEIRDAIASCVKRADEMGELVSMYWEGGKKPLANSLRKGLADAFVKFDRYRLTKYMQRGAIRVRDVMFLVHPKPRDDEQALLFKEIADQTATAPDTWEVALSAGADKRATFERLIDANELGALAVLRNLRNMRDAGVPREKVRDALLRNGRGVLPFQYVAASNACPGWESDIEQAMMQSLAGMGSLPGKTILYSDTSGSMNATLSAKSTLRRDAAAAALAMLTREVCEEVQVCTFDDVVREMPDRRGFALIDLLKCRNKGTNARACYDHAIRQDNVARVIILTDEQSATHLPALPKGVRGYIMNVAAYQNGIGYGSWTHVSGFSENLVRFIIESEARRA